MTELFRYSARTGKFVKRRWWAATSEVRHMSQFLAIFASKFSSVLGEGPFFADVNEPDGPPGSIKIPAVFY